LVGSSSTSSFGSWIIARSNPNFFFIPREYLST
jgi:hypothetical protein